MSNILRGDLNSDVEDGLVQTYKDYPNTGMLICVSGPSGVGKGTVIDALKKRMPFLAHSTSVTTRPSRDGEIEGTDYFFRTKEEFAIMIENNEILEHDVYGGNFYGTPRKAIEERVTAGEDIIMDVTVQGSLSILLRYETACNIFLLPPSLSELKERLVGRGTETQESLEFRLDKAHTEINMASKSDYVLINKDVEKTAEEIYHIIIAEKLRAARRPGIEKKVIER